MNDWRGQLFQAASELTGLFNNRSRHHHSLSGFYCFNASAAPVAFAPCFHSPLSFPFSTNYKR